MASEEPKTAPSEEAPVSDSKPAENNENGGKKNNGKKGQRDERPIEELYDLSKPIPGVDRPDKAKFDKEFAEIDARFELKRNEKRKVQQKIDASRNNGKGSEIGKHREALKTLRNKKQILINEKKVIRSELDSLKAAGDKLSQERKDTRSAVKFGTVEEIDKEIKNLSRRQETTSMSLGEEKKLIKELDALKASKDKIKSLKDKELDFEGVKLKRNAINTNIKAKDKEIDAVAKEMDVVGSKIKELSEKHTDKKGEVDTLFKDRERLNKEIKDILSEKDALRDAFREKSNNWYNFQRAVKARKKIEYDEEKKQRDEEHKAYLKKMEEEELKKVPYEEEQGLCEYLADYLERTYLGGTSTKDEEAKKEDVIAVKDDPFAGFKPVSKKDEEEEFMSKGKGKKKRQRQQKKDVAAPFTLNLDSFEQFGLIGMSPPTKLGEVEGSVKALREKKEWFKNQPRGSVPTAKDIRKQNEKAASKLRQSSGPSKGAAPKGKFNLSSEDFAPLGKGSSTAAEDKSSWGQKPAAEESS
ncbi:unnamed protein product [Cylindrotheca closterium]|uniref:Nuclear segregation protein n=1 Tax=Cylindrotheca closterium TaxID=2856 RepID=A0AAD2JHF3_9STRA|nr:unnamed protein product [Cylindrotheca closterium]